MATPHNKAEMGDIAKIVLMPGDPLRAKMIAETFLENPVQFNTVRNMFGYTGTYNGKKISVMGSGMGIPSIGIYSYELYKFYGVETIVRVGSTGAMQEEIELFDTILVTGAYSDSSFAINQSNDHDEIQKPDMEVTEKLRNSAEKLGIRVHEGTVYSSDVFYYEPEMMPAVNEKVAKYHLLGAEMESFGLFHVAKVLGKKAACMLTVSDSIVSHKETTSEERQNKLIDMIKISLDALTSD